MKFHRFILLFVMLVFCYPGSLLWAKPGLTSQAEKTTLSRLPQVFERNNGQVSSAFSYIAHTPETFFSFAHNRVSLQLNNRKKGNADNSFSMRFVGANSIPEISGLNEMPQKVNYLRGKSTQWVTNVPTFSKIEYTELYPGIDLQFFFTDTRMEFDFIVSPGVNPNLISFDIEHADSVQLNADGELVISLGEEHLIQRAPVLYQTIKGVKHPVKGRFKQQGNTIGFLVDAYNPEYTLVIDPIIEFSSYWGGEWEDQGNIIKTDSQGNIFLAGATSARARITAANILTSEADALPVIANTETESLYQAAHGISLSENIIAGESLDLNVKEAYDCDYRYKEFFDNDRIIVDYDAFISKFDSNFTPIFTTYMGGCQNETFRDMVLDVNDNVYVTGLSSSDDFPLKFPDQLAMGESRFIDDPDAGKGDAIYAKFTNDGDLLFSSYLGGDGQDAGRGIAVDEDENIYLLGYTRSLNLETKPCPAEGEGGIAALSCHNIGGINLAATDAGSQDVSVYSDVFIAKISSIGKVSYLSYFGGKYDDWGQSIILHDGSIYIAGNTSSPDLPTGDDGTYSYMPYNLNETKDVVKENRTELFCTLMRKETLADIRIADAHICRDVFLSKITIDEDNNSTINFLTYFGGDNDDSISAIAIDSNDNIYLVGTTKSQGARLSSGARNTLVDDLLEPRFPLYKNINNYKFDVNSIDTSAFFTVFNPEADTLIMSSFIGGNSGDTGNALVIREQSVGFSNKPIVDAYIAGNTMSDDFYTKLAFQSEPMETDIFLVKLSMDFSVSTLPYSNIPNHPSLCSLNSCNLYDIAYSTLIGGEGLDSVKSLALLPDEGALVMSGVSFSTKIPVTSDAVKTTNEGVLLKEFNTTTRELKREFTYHPSDMYLLKLSDTEENTALTLNLNRVGSGDVDEDDKLNFTLQIKNTSETQLAKSVRLLLKYPYLAKLEDLHQYIDITATDCFVDITQMYCVIGDVAVGETKDISLSIVAKHGGNFILEASVSSMTANESEETYQSSRVTVKESLGSFSFWVLALMLLSYGLRANVTPTGRK